MSLRTFAYRFLPPCPTRIDRSCRKSRIEQVGYVPLRQPLLIGTGTTSPRMEELGRCRRCGREHYKMSFWWKPMSSLLRQPADSAKVYLVPPPPSGEPPVYLSVSGRESVRSAHDASSFSPDHRPRPVPLS